MIYAVSRSICMIVCKETLILIVGQEIDIECKEDLIGQSHLWFSNVKIQKAYKRDAKIDAMKMIRVSLGATTVTEGAEESVRFTLQDLSQTTQLVIAK